jgi:nucleoside-diphosphate-sugar epimerase
MKNVIVLGGGGFIGGHLAKKLKEQGNHVRICDLKKHEYFFQGEICDEFIVGDLTDPKVVELVIGEGVDEVYQLAADMGGAMYIFTGQHDADVMYNSATINLNVVRECVKKKVGKVFYSSSACMYPEHNQLDPENPNCEESSAYPANPDSEYGWEKLFSERLYLAHQKNYGLDVKIARFHNIYGPQGTWNGGREKAPAAMCRKVVEAKNGDEIEVWGDGNQTRSFLYVDECVRAILELMNSKFSGPVNIGSEEMVSINKLAEIAISVSGKNLVIKNLEGEEFKKKYGFKCPLGVKGRNSDNKLYKENLGSDVFFPLDLGIKLTYNWIKSEVDNVEKETKWIYESPDGKTVYKRKPSEVERIKIK